jgi:hypothetical protein
MVPAWCVVPDWRVALDRRGGTAHTGGSGPRVDGMADDLQTSPTDRRDRSPGDRLRVGTSPRRSAALLGGALAVLGLVASASPTGADTWSAAGLSFRVGLGEARLLAVDGRGTRDDPIVLVEEITGPGPATIVIRNDRNGAGQTSPGSGGHLMVSMVVIVANRGPWRWSGFDLELRTGQDQPSVYTDGLSFDQPQAVRGAATADRFAHAVQNDEPFDQIRFDGGRVDPAERLRLEFAIVDINGRRAFHLVQYPIVLLARAAPPAATTDVALARPGDPPG